MVQSVGAVQVVEGDEVEEGDGEGDVQEGGEEAQDARREGLCHVEMIDRHMETTLSVLCRYIHTRTSAQEGGNNARTHARGK